MKKKEEKQKALPTGWREVRLGEVVEIIGGGTPKTEVSEYWDGSIPWLTPPDFVSSNRWVNNSKKTITEPGLNSSPTKLLQKGDLIFSARGTVGAVAQLEKPMAFSQTSYGLKAKPGIVISDFLFYLLRHNRKRIQKLSYGATFDTVTTKTFNFIAILLPPLPEQKAIASLLEKWDTAIEKTEAVIAAKEKRFKWLLKTLISDQQDNPQWRKVKLGNACEVIVSPVDKKTVDGELPVKLCNYTDVYYNNAIDSRISFMTATAKPQEIEKFSIIKDDVLITKDSETPDDIGVPAYVKETIDNLLCGYHLTILRPKKQTIGKYICYALTSPRVKNDFYRFANGITRFGLTTESYQKIKIPLPLLPEQTRIANTLDTAREEIEFLKRLAETYRTQKRGLMQKLLTGEWQLLPSFPRKRE